MPEQQIMVGALKTLVVGFACLLAAGGQSTVEAAYPLGSNKHLFLDDFLIDQRNGVELVVNPPERKELVMIADKPWERGGITSYANVFWDPNFDEYRMYYVPVDLNSNPIFRLAMATSQDGITWEKPNLGVVSWNGSTNNNIVIEAQREGTVMIDPHGTPDRRYVFVSSNPDLRTRLFTSPNGIEWTQQPELISSIHSDSQISSFWDDQLQKYVHYPRIATPELGRATGRVEVSAIDDPWPSEIPIVLSRDNQDPAGVDLYTNSAQKYALANDTYVAFPTPYYHYNEPSRDYLNDPALENGGSTNDGVIETQLAVSRDGIEWTRYRTPYVPLYHHEELDLKINMIFPGMLYHETHIDQYFGGYTFTHGDRQARNQLEGRELGGVFRVEQRIDGFVSADFPYAGGDMITDPIVFIGEKLVLNLNTSATGEARVAILDMDGNEIEGYGLDDARIINGDYFDRTVTWDHGSDVSSLAGQPVRLMFSARNTKLYSMQFTCETTCASDFLWGRDASGSWNWGTNWAPSGAVNGNDVTVTFGDVITAPRVVYVDQPATIKRVIFDSPTSYVIAGVSSVNFAAATGNAMVDVSRGAHEFQAEVELNSDTTVNVAEAAELVFNNELRLNGNVLFKTGDGELRINNVLDTGGGTVIGLGGVIAGSGSIVGGLRVAGGTVAPGNSPGTLRVLGSYVQDQAGRLEIDLGGIIAGAQYDQLVVAGAVTLDGTIDVMLLDGFSPRPGDSFDVIVADSIFDLGVEVAMSQMKGISFDIQIAQVDAGQALRLTVAVPEPTSFALLIIATTALSGRRLVAMPRVARSSVRRT